MARIKVVGKYLDARTYVLYNEDGGVSLTLREGEEFYVANQLRPFVPERVPKKNGRGTILVCRQYRDNGDVLEEFALPHNKVGLWATSSGSARNGVFHSYREPKDALEQTLAKYGVSRGKIEVVNKIDHEFYLGGRLCHHVVHKSGWDAASDCSWEDLSEPSWVTDSCNQYHIGCMDSEYRSRAYGGTYVVHYHISTTMNGSIAKYIEQVLITPDVDRNAVADAVEEIYS